MIISKRDLHSIIIKASIQNREAEAQVEAKKFGDLIKRDSRSEDGLDTLAMFNAIEDYKWLRDRQNQIEEIRKFLETVGTDFDIEIRGLKKDVASLMRGGE